MGDVAVIVYIWCFDHVCRLQCSQTLSCGIVNEISRYCSGGCRGNTSCLSAYKGCQLLVDGCLWSSATKITQDARPKYIHTPLTLNFKTGRRASRFLFAYKGDNTALMNVHTQLPLQLPVMQDKNCLCFIDAHNQDRVGSVAHPLWPIQAANTSLMNVPTNRHLDCTKAKTKNRWCSFCQGCIPNMQSFHFT